ncbi:MAG TPA: ribbon-helix-helix domain-containing protein [Candidatus Acidoferrales bacterium]|nr:ribbon-helix-helix domain-containing protein [Candidatus Acidoferrales bacterium]
MIFMERVTLRLLKQQLELIDTLVIVGGFSSGSEAIRTAARDLVNARVKNIFNRIEEQIT